jgi:hypothetical protein
MRNRIQLNCAECRRKKIKCDRLEPCAGCIKSNIVCVYNKFAQKSIEFSNQSKRAYESHANGCYTIYKMRRIYNKWFNLTYTLERMVDFCHLDPKLNYINVSPKIVSKYYDLNKGLVYFRFCRVRRNYW